MPDRKCFVCIVSLFVFWLRIFAGDCPAESRTALVVGIGDYAPGRLVNTTNDADDIAEALKEMGFEVTKLKNADLRAMEEALDDFFQKMKRNGGTGLFYYAGHGVQVKGQNYLVPVDAKIESESDVQYKALDASRVLGKMEDAGNEVNIVILDACRDNPFARSFRSDSKGLSRMDAPAGSLIAYATAPGAVASDGEGRNGIYTGNLIRNMRTPGLSIEQVLKQTRRDVMAMTENRQVPWESSSLTGDFFFLSAVGGHPGERSADKPKTVLSVEVNVKDANVYIDGQRAGVGSLENFEVSPGEHRIQMARDGFRSYDADIVVTAGREHRVNVLLEPLEAQAANGNQRQWRDPVLEMEFVWVPEGCLDDETSRGGAGEEKTHSPPRSNCVENFWIGKTEVTVGQWRRFVAETGYETEAQTGGGAYIRTQKEWVKRDGTFWEEPGFAQTDDRPVTCVSLADVLSFISWLNGKAGAAFRLPTEAEWEHACRAKTADGRKWRDDPADTCKYANFADVSFQKNRSDTASAVCDDGSAETGRTGALSPNPLGIHDMLGNVWEWCSESPGNRPTGRGEAPPPSTVAGAIIRGGGWNAAPNFIRCESRIRVDPLTRTNSLGFRLLKQAEPER